MDQDLESNQLSEPDVIALKEQIFLQELMRLLGRMQVITQDRKVLILIREIEELCEKFK